MMNRRDFSLLSLAIIASGAGGGYLLSSYKANEHLRPPGAAKHFESLCIKCGQCLQVCPYHSISLLGVDDGVNIGSAYIDASKRGCYLCDLFPCVLACPSGALDHNTTTIKDVKMGVAVVINESNCYANKVISKNQVEHLLARKTYNDREEKAKQIIADNVGKNCSLCVSSCPVNGAITLGRIPAVNESCVGCGVCEEVCFANVIKIIPKG